MKVIGLTGGIGSGKSTVARVFETLGLPVFDADREALALYGSDASLRLEVASAFGAALIAADGTVDRQELAAIVFSDEAALQRLNTLVHPRVAHIFSQWKKQQQSDAVIREAAILFESGSNVDCDWVIVVTAPEQLRIERVMRRNGMSEEAVRQRMARQWKTEMVLARADAVVVNDDKQLVLPQVLGIAAKLGLLLPKEK